MRGRQLRERVEGVAGALLVVAVLCVVLGFVLGLVLTLLVSVVIGAAWGRVQRESRTWSVERRDLEVCRYQKPLVASGLLEEPGRIVRQVESVWLVKAPTDDEVIERLWQVTR